MGTFSYGSGSASGSVAWLQELADPWVNALEAGFIGTTAPTFVGQMPTNMKVSLKYDLASTVRVSARHGGRRAVGDDFKPAPPQDWKDLSAETIDRGLAVTLDEADGYGFEDPVAAASNGQIGYQRSAQHLRTLLHQDAVDLLTAASTPFSTADQAASASWDTVTTNIMVDITTARRAVETTLGFAIPLNSITMSTHTFQALQKNTALTANFGGNQGAGLLSPAAIQQALAGHGITEVNVAHDTDLSGWVVLGHKPTQAMSLSPSGRMIGAASYLMCTHSYDSLVQTQMPDYRDRKWRYLVYANYDMLVVPELAVRISGAT